MDEEEEFRNSLLDLTVTLMQSEAETVETCSDNPNDSPDSNDVTNQPDSNDVTNQSDLNDVTNWSASNDVTNQSTSYAGSQAKSSSTGAPETAAENIAAVPLTAVNDSLSLTQTSSINLEDPSSKPNIERTLKVLEQLANQIHVNVASPSSNSNLAGVAVSSPVKVILPRRGSSSQLLDEEESSGTAQTSTAITSTPATATSGSAHKLTAESIKKFQDSLLTNASEALKTLNTRVIPGSNEAGSCILKNLLISSPRPPDNPVLVGLNSQGLPSASLRPATVAGPARPLLRLKLLQTGKHERIRFSGTSPQRSSSPLTPVPIRPRVQAAIAAKTPQDPGTIPMPTATLHTLDENGKVIYQMEFPLAATNPLINTLSVSPITPISTNNQININISTTMSGVVSPQAPLTGISMPVATVASNAVSTSARPSQSPETQSQQSEKAVTFLQKKHVIMKSIGKFEVFLRHPLNQMSESASNQFICLCFDLGTFWVSNENSGFIKTINLNKTYRASFMHTDASRNTYDRAVLHFGTKKLLASKPGTASETLNLVKNRTTFFLQEGALLKVSNLIEKDFKLRFVAKAKVLLGSSGNSRDFTLPKDFNYLNEIAKLMDDQVITLNEDDDEPEVVSINPGPSQMSVNENNMPIVSNTGPSRSNQLNESQISDQPFILPTETCNQSTLYQLLNYVELHPCQSSSQNPGASQPNQSAMEVQSQFSSSAYQLLPQTFPTSSSNQGFTVSNTDSFVQHNSSLDLALLSDQSRHVNQCSNNQQEIQSHPVYTSTSQSNLVMNRMPESNSNTIFEPNSTSNNLIISSGLPVASDSAQSFQYDALYKSHWKVILFCESCQWNFQFFVEWVIHFSVIKKCKKSIRKSYPEEMSLYEVLRLYTKKMGNLETYQLKCNECNQSFDCPLTYCLHRDQHKSRIKFICPICTGLYHSPYKYYRHSCLEKQKEGISKKPRPPRDTTEFYRQLPADKVAMMLCCPICKKKCRYASHFTVHLRDSQNCYTSLSLLHKKDKPIFYLDLYFEDHYGLPRESIECDQCTDVLDSWWAYLLHIDHHAFYTYQSYITCKTCTRVFTSPCIFYKHRCHKTPHIYWCFHCCKMSILPTNNVEIINLDDSPPRPVDNDDDSQIFMKMEVVLDNIKICHEDDKTASVTPQKETGFRSQTPNRDTNQHADSEIADLDFEGLEPSSPLTPFSINTIEDQDLDDGDSSDVAKLDLEDCYLCLDCDNKVMTDSDQLSDHCQTFSDHYNINPLCVYNSFSLQLSDVAKSKEYHEVVEKLLNFYLHEKNKKLLKRRLREDTENQGQPPLKLTTSEEFEYKQNRFQDCSIVS